MLYAFFWVIIPRHLNFICRHFGTLCLFHLHRQVAACRMNSAGDMFGVLYGKRFGLEMAWAIRMEGDRVGGGSEYRNKLWRVPAYIQLLGNHPKESIQHSGYGKSLKSRILPVVGISATFFHLVCSKSLHSVGYPFSCIKKLHVTYQETKHIKGEHLVLCKSS